MELKEYQIKTLERVKNYLTLLSEWKKKAEENPDFEIDFPAKAWEKVGLFSVYLPKKNGLEKPLPNFCLKIPTGGGKTLLAVKAIDLINQNYLKKQTGLVLWVVPTSQIYNQTLKSLKDKDHPYRQHLDIASGGRTLIKEKNEHFTPQDLEENLVILVLMLQSSSRQSKEQLKVFKDNGFNDFFPLEDDIEGQLKVLKMVPNLDVFGEKDGFWGNQIKTSLGNVLRLCNPLMILDEGHKTYSPIAQDTLKNLNPSIIVELSATPLERSNILVDIPGMDLLREEMIKLDLHIINKVDTDWKNTMYASVERRNSLEEKALLYDSNTNNYIRPINVIQVERTGKEQRQSGLIHSEDVKEYLIKTVGIPEEQIAIKTSEKDELKEVDDIGGLLSRDCHIRYIITKQALQEGWDCPFAYVLTILTSPTSQNALTQLVGRILRQPYAKKTGIKELDESYVYCFQQKANLLLDNIKRGFENEGLGDLYSRVSTDDGFDEDKIEEKTYEVREKFKQAAKEVILPIFLINDHGKWRKVNYESDLVSKIIWESVDLKPLFSLFLSKTEEKDIEQIATLVEDRKKVMESVEVRKLREGAARADLTFLTHQLNDIVLSPWITFEIGKKVIGCLTEKYGEKMVLNNFVFIVEEIKKHLIKEKDRLSEMLFRDYIENGTLRFLVIGKEFGYKLPPTSTIKNIDTPLLKGSNLVQKSLFEVVADKNFNETEKSVAFYLEDQDKLLFWYRNTARQDYAIQGWRKQKVYADFIFTTTVNEKSIDKIYVAETKGKHLLGNEDSEYKENLFDLCNSMAKERRIDELGLSMKEKELSFEFIGEDEWKQRLNAILA